MDGDTYETQEVAFSRDLDVFWADLVGPDESWRQNLLEAVGGAAHNWRTITISRDGAVHVALGDGSTKAIQPPTGVPVPASGA